MTLKRLPKMSGAQIARAASSFSLLLLSLTCLAGPYADLDRRLRETHDPLEQMALLSDAASRDPNLRAYVDQGDPGKPGSMKRAREYVRLAAVAEGSPAAASAASDAKQIKSSPLYADDRRSTGANWLSGAVERLGNLLARLRPQPRELNAPNVEIGGFARLITYAVWFLLAAGIAVFLFVAARWVHISKARKRLARAMLDESEPERTLDEWLALADALEREGRFREAVRALYLACLLRFDEANVARFLRHQTNWEHLQRIDASPRKPADLDFRSPTRAFDQIWYGGRTRGSEDVAQFRDWYALVTQRLREKAA